MDVTTAGRFGNLQKGHGIAFADFDNDGDQDLLAQLGGSFPADAYFPNFFVNPGFGNHWITLRLQGVKANRAAIGSRVQVTVTEGEIEREIHALVSSGGSFGSNSLQVEMGLGKAEKILALEITWAGSLHKDRFRDVPMDRILKVVEGQPQLEVVPQASFRFEIGKASPLRPPSTRAAHVQR